MPILAPQKIVITGKRFASRQDFEDNVTAMSDIAEELIDLVNFEMTCHAKVLLYVEQPILSTEQDFQHDGVWTYIRVVIAVDEDSDGTTRRVEV